MAEKIIYAISDSLGETAETVARATASQYDKEQIEIVRIPYIDSESQIDEVIADAKRGNHVICHTIVSESLRKYLHEKVAEYNIPAVDIMGPVLDAVGTVASTKPRMTAGMVHKLDQEYFKKVEAIEFAQNAEKNGFGVLISAAGKAAHLGGVIAANTVLPVIGIPIKASALEGVDALLSTVQMPPGIPVASVAIDGAKNAAILAVEMLTIGDPDLNRKLWDERKKAHDAVVEKDAKISAQFN